MKYIYTIDLTEESEAYERDQVSILYTGDTCRIAIGDTSGDLKHILNDATNYEFIKTELKDCIAYNQENDPQYAKECQEFLTLLEGQNACDFFKKIDNLNLMGSNDAIIAYLKNNPWLQKLNITKTKAYSLSEEGLKQAIMDVEKIKSAINCEVSVIIEGNEESTSIKDFKKVLEIIDNIVLEVRSLKLSPFESVLYVYDLIRNREYKEENEDEVSTKSRDLTSILLGDKIVCAGFVNMFNTILQKLGISCNRFRLLSLIEYDNHVETIAYLKDDKYNIDGLYIFDPTFECKDKDDSYLKSYYYFAKTFNEMQVTYNNQNMAPYCQYLTKESIAYLEETLPDKITAMVMGNYRLLKGINQLLLLIKENPLKFTSIYDKKSFIAQYQKVNTSLNHIIPIETFIKAFSYVRAIEYYLYPAKYFYDKETIIDATFTNSVFKMSINKELLNFLKILDIRPSSFKRQRIKEIVNQSFDARQIERVKLTRLLREKLMLIK